MDEGGGEGEGCGGRFHTVQPHRDLELNWGVDIAASLEEYLLKICSGEIVGDDGSQISVNFAEAALLLQGSIQVYSRKVEYLYNLVLHALDFISQKGQPKLKESEDASTQAEEGSSFQQQEEEDDFWVSDDIPVDPKSRFDTVSGKEGIANRFDKPPSNLVVLEGDCLDTTGDAGELESYLLATCELYRDFILLDPSDSVTVDDYLKENESGNWNANKGESLGPKSFKGFQSPGRHTGGSTYRSSNKKYKDNDLNSPGNRCMFETVDKDMDPGPSTSGMLLNDDSNFEMHDGYSDQGGFDNEENEEEEDDVWKPLNPHEPGNLKVKPFKKVKTTQKIGVNPKLNLITSQFPLAKLHGPISPELAEIWEARLKANENQQEPQSPPLYEKLRESLIRGGSQTFDAFRDSTADKMDAGYDNNAPDIDEDDADMPYMDEDLPFPSDKDDVHASFDANEGCAQEDPSSQTKLEDLCRSHLDALLASIAETETQTELAARVSSWKQKIETNLEEQDSRPPFDIHDYGDRVMDKLVDMESGDTVSFADIVEGHKKYDVARTFSALLQLVNNGDIDLDKGGLQGDIVCYTASNPFQVKLLALNKKRRKIQLSAIKRKAKSPNPGTNSRERNDRANGKKAVSSPSKFSSQISGKINMNGVGIKCTPESKRRRKLRLAEPVDLKVAECHRHVI